ncbi:MAG: hypothetical protein Q8P62_00400 [Candidatus Peregrinibacteria bacterium]|nr:hypothetical protein [Candidatus Peregrinibacteria bacterium]
MAIKKFLDCISNYSQKLSQKENRFVYFADAEKPAPAETQKEPKDMNHEEFKKYLQEKTRVSIEGTGTDQKFVFPVKNQATERFPWTQEFEDKLKKLNIKDLAHPVEITQAVLAEFERVTKSTTREALIPVSNDPAKKLDAKKENPAFIERKNFIRTLSTTLQEKYKTHAEKITWTLIENDATDSNKFKLQATDKKTNAKIVSISAMESPAIFIVGTSEQSFLNPTPTKARSKFEELLNLHLEEWGETSVELSATEEKKAYIETLQNVSTDFEKKTAPAEITDQETRKDIELYYKQAAESIAELSTDQLSKIIKYNSFPVSQSDLDSAFTHNWTRNDRAKAKAKATFTKTISDKLVQKANATSAEIAKETPTDKAQAIEHITKLLRAFTKIQNEKDIGFVKNAPFVLKNCLNALSAQQDRNVPRVAISQVTKEYELFGVNYMQGDKTPEKIKATFYQVLRVGIPGADNDPEYKAKIDTLLAKAFPEAESKTPVELLEKTKKTFDRTIAKAGETRAKAKAIYDKMAATDKRSASNPSLPLSSITASLASAKTAFEAPTKKIQNIVEGKTAEGTFDATHDLTNGRTIEDTGTVEQGEFHEGKLKKGQRVNAIGTIEEGEFQNRNLQNGRIIFTNGEIQEGEFDTNTNLTSGIKIDQDGKITKIPVAAPAPAPAAEQPKVKSLSDDMTDSGMENMRTAKAELQKLRDKLKTTGEFVSAITTDGEGSPMFTLTTKKKGAYQIKIFQDRKKPPYFMVIGTQLTSPLIKTPKNLAKYIEENKLLKKPAAAPAKTAPAPAPTPASVSAPAPAASAPEATAGEPEPDAKREPELTQEYKANHEQTLKMATATRTKAAETLRKSNEVLAKAKATLTPLPADVQTAIDEAQKAANDSTTADQLKGKAYAENTNTTPHRTEIGERTPAGILTKGRAVDKEGTILEGNFATDGKQALIKGRAILNDGTILEGNYDPNSENITKGKAILPSGEIQEGEFDPKTGSITKGRSILPSGIILEGTFANKTLATGTRTTTDGKVETWENGKKVEHSAQAPAAAAAPAGAPTTAAPTKDSAPARVEKRIDATTLETPDFKTATTPAEKAEQAAQIQQIEELIAAETEKLEKLNKTQGNPQALANAKAAIDSTLVKLKSTLEKLKKGEVLTTNGKEKFMKGSSGTGAAEAPADRAAGAPAKAKEAAPAEPEIPATYKTKYEETLAKAKATRALTHASVRNKSKPLDPTVQAAIDNAEKAAQDATKNLTGSYTDKKTYTEIGEKTGKIVTKGRKIAPNGTTHEGEFDKELGGLTKGRKTSPDGTIQEGEFDANTVTLKKGRIILPNGTTYEGEFDQTGRLTKGRKTSPDGTIQEGEFHQTGYLKKGTKTLPNRTILTGKWDKEGKKNGTVTETQATAEKKEPTTAEKIAKLKKQIDKLYAQRDNPNTSGAQASEIGDKIIKLENQVKGLEAATAEKKEPPTTEAQAEAPAPTPPPTTEKPAAPEATPEVQPENEVITNAVAIADAAAKIANEAAKTAATAGERTPKAGERPAIYRNKQGTLFTGIVGEDNKLVEGRAITKKNTKFEGLIDPKTRQIIFGRITLKTGEKFEGEFHPAEGGKAAQLKEGRHVSADGKTTEEGLFDKDSNKLINGRRITTSTAGKLIEVGKFDKDTGKLIDGKKTKTDGTIEVGKFDKGTGNLIDGIRTLPNGDKEKGKWNPDGKPNGAIEKIAAPVNPTTKNITNLASKNIIISGEKLNLPDAQAKAIETLSTALEPALLAAKTPTEVRDILEKLSTNISKTLVAVDKDTGIKKIEFPAFGITWTNQPINQFDLAGKDSFRKLIKKISGAKKEKHGPRSPEFETFRKEIKKYEDTSARLETDARYKTNYKALATKTNLVDESVHKLGEDGIEAKWAFMKGHGRIDKILTTDEGPFKLDDTQTGRFVAQVITEGLDFKIDLEHIFKFAAQYNKDFPQDFGDFMKKYETLSAKANKTPDEQKELAKMFNEVLSPALRLLESIQKLRYNQEKAKETAEILTPKQQKIRTSLSSMFTYSEREPGKWERLMGWMQGVEHVDADDEKAGKVPVLTDLDGEIKYLDRGILRRSFDPKAAYAKFIETSGAITVDENDKRTIDPVKMLAKTNELIALGGRSIAIRKLMLGEGKKSLDELQKDKDFAKKLKALVPAPLTAEMMAETKEIPKEQMEAFQLGFILGEDMQYDTELAETQALLREESPENAKNPAIEALLKDLEKQGVSKEDIINVEAQILAMGALTFNQHGDLQGAGVAFNKKIKIGKNTTLTIGGGKTREGTNIGAALTFSIYEGENFKCGSTLEFDLRGVGASLNTSWEDVNIGIGRAKISFSVGGRLGKGISLGAGVLITRRNVALRIAENKANLEKETGINSQEWEAFKASKGKPTEERYALLKKVTKLYNAIVIPYKSTFPGDQAVQHRDIVYMMDSFKDAVTDKAVDQIASSPWEFFQGVGVVATIYPPFFMLVGVFKLGSAKVFIPSRDKLGKIKDKISNKIMRRKLEVALQEAEKRMKEGKSIGVEAPTIETRTYGPARKIDFKGAQKTANLVYNSAETAEIDPNGSPRVTTSKARTSFADLLKETDEPEWKKVADPTKETPLEIEADKLKRFNKKLLKEVQLQLGEDKDGKRELKVLNTYNKDVEVYIDPRIPREELGLTVEGGKLYITGDIDKIAITRERFYMPFKSQKSTSSIKDIIVLGNQGSVAGTVDREYIERYSSAYAEKLEGDMGFSLETGYGESAQENIKEGPLAPEEQTEVKAISTAKAAKLKQRQDEQAARETGRQQFIADVEKGKKAYDARKKEKETRKTEAKEMDTSTAKRTKALDAIKTKALKEQTVPPAFDADIVSLAKNPAFRKELGEITGNDEKIKTLILTYAKKTTRSGKLLYPALQNITKKGHENEINHAMIGVLNKWFLTLLRDDKQSDKAIHRTLAGRIRFATQIFTESFEASRKAINARLPNDQQITISSAEIAKEITDRIYKKIRKGDFKFNDINWGKNSPDIQPIEEGSTVFSTTRLRKKHGKKGAGTLAKTIAYVSKPGTQGQTLGLNNGFIKAAMQDYTLNTGTPKEQQIARILFEMASPSPEKEVKTADQARSFLTSPLALRLAGLETLMLVPKFGKAKFDKISELYGKITNRNPNQFNALYAKKAYKDAVDAYLEIVKEVRAAQLAGKPYEKEFEWGNDNYKLVLNMTTTIQTGAYARCANGTVAVKEDGEISIYKVQPPVEGKVFKPGQPPHEEVLEEPIAVYRESTKTRVKSKQSKAELKFATAVGVNIEDEPETEPKKNAAEGPTTKIDTKQATPPTQGEVPPSGDTGEEEGF